MDMKEQATVTGYFPVVKNRKSTFKSHSTKRKKIEEVPVNLPRSKKLKLNSDAKSADIKQKGNEKFTVSRLLSATPVIETVKQSDAPKKCKRETSCKVETAAELKAVSAEDEAIPKVEEDLDLRTSDVKIDPWISDQAKLVLAVGRGCAAIQASHAKIDSSSSKPLKASHMLKPPTDSQGNSSKGNVREEYLKTFNENVKSARGRGRLRQKYSNLLNPDIDSSEEERPTLKNSEDPVSKLNLRMPAHQRFKQLASKTTEAPFLLPQGYKKLLEMFRAVDSVLFLLHRRSETCTFERLKKSVQSMLGRLDDFQLFEGNVTPPSIMSLPKEFRILLGWKFTEKHLAQMKKVFPDGLIFRIERNLKDLNGMPCKQQLTIDANFEKGFPKKNNSKSDINQTILITRRQLFETSLANITKEHHQQYLKRLNVKIADADLQRWHPHFKLDEVPEIAEAPLPQATVTKSVTSARDILERNHYIPQVEKAMQKVAEASASIALRSNSSPQNSQIKKKNPTTSVETRGILKGVSSSLLERIREKELKKAEIAMLRDPKQERRLFLMERFPDVVRILKAFFTSEKKAAIPLEDCVTKISQSFGTSTSTSDIEEHVKLLNEVAPDWLTIVFVRKCQYVKISKTQDVNEVLNKLDKVKMQEQKR